MKGKLNDGNTSLINKCSTSDMSPTNIMLNHKFNCNSNYNVKYVKL